MPAPLLALDGIAKSFGSVRALKGVSFALEAGEVHALLGENGAGKSTLIKVITGAHSPDRGSITLAGEPVTHLTPARAHRLGIAAIYQQPALFPDLSVAENIALRLDPPTPWRRVRWAAWRQRAQLLLARIGAEIDPEAEVRALSMPEQQLVEIACALGAGARIVIMDEPTASLTQQEQDRLSTVVRELRKAGTGVIYITHRLEEIFALADRVTVLRDGESVAAMPVSETSEEPLIRLMVGRAIDTIYPPPEAPPGAPRVTVQGLSCQAGGLRGIDLEIRAGEVLGLAGLVGAGRTELARTLFGLTPADAGTILLDGRVASIRSPQDAVRAGIAYLPEDRRRHGVVGELELGANITLGIHPTFFPGGWLRPKAEASLTGEFIRNLSIKAPGPWTPAAALSGGNQQKVALARWLATKPKLLILDEPTQGVDVGAKSEIHKIIRSLAREGLAVLLISSDLPEVLAMSDRIAVMRQGTIVAEFSQGAEAHEIMAAALGQAGKEAA